MPEVPGFVVSLVALDDAPAWDVPGDFSGCVVSVLALLLDDELVLGRALLVLGGVVVLPCIVVLEDELLLGGALLVPGDVVPGATVMLVDELEDDDFSAGAGDVVP